MQLLEQPNVRRPMLWLLLLPLLSLAGCETTCPKPSVVSPTLPSKPSVSTPLPSVTYTESARLSSQKRRERLLATQVMSSSSPSPGR